VTLHADVTLDLGDLHLDVDLCAPGEAVTAVLGPNGAGKTTLLRCITGSLAIDAGSISFDDAVFDEPPAVFLPQERRNLGVVHQDYLLFPHMSVLDNVAFGPRSRHRPAREARRIAAGWLERIGMETYAAARPKSLSGGQAQRVALARALAIDPAALLLDEPLAALDAGSRLEVRRDLRRYLNDYGGATILVTHDPVDALALADHVAILEHGSLTQVGTIAEVTARPRSRYVADLIGTNLIHGTAHQTTLTTTNGTTLTTSEAHDGPVFATISPADVVVHRMQPEGSARNRWQASMADIDVLGDRVRAHLVGPMDLIAEITPAAAAELELREGDTIWASVKATEITVYPE